MLISGAPLANFFFYVLVIMYFRFAKHTPRYKPSTADKPSTNHICYLQQLYICVIVYCKIKCYKNGFLCIKTITG